MQKIRAVRLFILSLLVLLLTAASTYATGNLVNPGPTRPGSGPVNGYRVNSTNSQGGARWSIYWAPSEEDMIAGRGVMQLGKSVDIFSNPPPASYLGLTSGTSIHDYKRSRAIYQANRAMPITSGPLVANFPDTLTTDRNAISRWLTGKNYGTKAEDLTWPIIPELTKAMGSPVTVEQFKEGYFPREQQYGQYRIFYEPIMGMQLGSNVGRVMTLRDLIMLETEWVDII